MRSSSNHHSVGSNLKYRENSVLVYYIPNIVIFSAVTARLQIHLMLKKLVMLHPSKVSIMKIASHQHIAMRLLLYKLK